MARALNGHGSAPTDSPLYAIEISPPGALQAGILSSSPRPQGSPRGAGPPLGLNLPALWAAAVDEITTKIDLVVVDYDPPHNWWH